MVVITPVGTRALWEEGVTDTGDLQERLDLYAVITRGSCYSSPQEVNREYHALFDCFSEGKEYWLEIMKSYLMIKVSTESTSHFPICFSWKIRENIKPENPNVSLLFLPHGFLLKRHISFHIPILFSPILVVLFIAANESITDVCRSLWHFMRCCSGEAMQQPQCFLRCRQDPSPQDSPWESLWGTSGCTSYRLVQQSLCAFLCYAEE